MQLKKEPSHNFDGLDLDLVRRIDVVCLRFEADRRDGRRGTVDEYLDDVPEEGRAALRAELEALERELRPSDKSVSRAEPGVMQALQSFTMSEASTVSPGPEPTVPNQSEASSSVHGEALLPTRDDATVKFGPSASPSSEPAASPCIHYFGDYEIVGEIARGGMGVVFEARQVSLNRKVALKMILAGQLAKDTDVKRFYTEAEAAANLDHPAIVPIFEIGQHNGQHYFSMGLVEGQSLAQRLAAGPLPPREAAALLVKVAEAIEYAHSRGVIHRDLKPGNILLDKNDNPRVTDFGLARKVDGDGGLTASGQIIGTPSYMPPEQAGGKSRVLGPAADVYALGATLYAVVTGRPPFQAATAMDTLVQVLSDEPVPPRRLNPALDRDLETICLKCLEKQPLRRYAGAAAFGEDLRRYLQSEPIRARRVGAGDRARKWARRRPAIASLLGLLLTVTVLGVAGVAWQWRKTSAALAEVRSSLYLQLISAADQAWRADNGAHVEVLLDDCPTENRGWEWNFLKRRNHASRLTLAGRLGSNVGRIAYSPDGRFIVAVGEMESALCVWNAATGAVAFPKDGREPDGLLVDNRRPGTISFACSPDGRRVAVGRETGIEILNIGTGKKIRDYARGEQDEVRVGSYRKDGRTIACVIGADKAGIIDAESGRVLRSRTVKAGLDYLVFAPDGQHVAQFGDDSTSIYLLDLTNDETPITLNGHTHQVRDLAFDGEGRVLVSVDHNGAFIVWDTTDGRVLHTFSAGAISALAVNSDGSTVATAEEDHTLTVRNAATGRLISAQRRPDVRIVKLAFSPDGKRIVSIDGHGVAKVWDTTADPPVRSLKTADPWIGSMCFSPDGRRLATVEGRHVTRSEVEVVVRIWDVAAGHEIHSLHGYSEEIFSNVAFHPDGNRVALSMGPARDDHRVHIWDLAAGRATLAFPDKEAAQHSDFTYAVAFHAHGDALATTDAILGLLTLWNIPSGRERFTAKPAVGAILDVEFSPDGRWIATAGKREAVLWDVITGREVVRLRGPEDWISAVAFNPDGRQIAIASSDRTIWVYEAATGRRLLTLFGHEDRVTDVAYSPDGRRIASTANDRMVKLWEASTGREILSIREAGHKVVFSPDGNLMATVDEGGVKLWDGRPWSEPDGRSAAPAR